jgi:hypothetical protein
MAGGWRTCALCPRCDVSIGAVGGSPFRRTVVGRSSSSSRLRRLGLRLRGLWRLDASCADERAGRWKYAARPRAGSSVADRRGDQSHPQRARRRAGSYRRALLGHHCSRAVRRRSRRYCRPSCMVWSARTTADRGLAVARANWGMAGRIRRGSIEEICRGRALRSSAGPYRTGSR